MITEIRMPQFGVTMDFGTIAEWHKQPGDEVHVGDVLLTIETEKLVNDVLAEADGILLAVVASEGDEVPVQGLLGAIGAAGENWSPASEAPAEAQPEIVAEVTAPAKQATEKQPVSSMTPEGRILASPLARARAKELGVDLTKLHGTGTTGRIKEKDVLTGLEQQKEEALEAKIEARVAAAVAAALAQLPAPASAPVPKAEEKPLTPMEGDVREKMSPARKVIARRMTESIVKAPQVTLTREILAEPLLEFHRRLKEKYPQQKITLNDLMIKLLASAITAEPVLNVSVDGESLLRHSQVNIGFAVALPGSLLVPVVRNADKKSLTAIAMETKQLIADCRAGTLKPEALSGGTMSISNLGSFGVDGFTPIVNLPEAAILGVGRTVKRPVAATDGSLRLADTMVLSLSFDHRAADGAAAAAFLKTLADMVEAPLSALL